MLNASSIAARKAGATKRAHRCGTFAVKAIAQACNPRYDEGFRQHAAAIAYVYARDAAHHGRIRLRLDAPLVPKADPETQAGPADWPDLSRTAAALDAYDEALAVIDFLDSSPDDATFDDLQVEHASLAVAEAFALDTADRNSRGNALLMRPTPKKDHPDNDCTLRKWVREWQAQKET